jgi:membrane associated rhomboid family serine protease
MTPAPVGLRCPEHSGKAQGVRKVTAAATRVASGQGSRSGYPVTIVLVAINVGVYLLELALGGTADGQSNPIYNHGALVAKGVIQGGNLYGVTGVPGTPPGVVGVAAGEWWRLIAAAFLHFGPLHLAVNMLGLYWLGRVLEHVIGSWRYLLLYLTAGLGGSAGALWVSHAGLFGFGPGDVTVGASGAIFGVLGGLLVLERRGAIASGGQIMGLIVLNLVFTFALSGISIGGHIGGLVAGIVQMLLYLQFRGSNPICLASAVGVSAVAVVIAYCVV